MNLEEYTQYHETKVHERYGFPYNTYLCTIPEDFPNVSLHWHEQMEIIYIKRGSGRVSVNLKPYHVTGGSIIPVLPGELHAIDGDPGVRMEYENIIFSLSLLENGDGEDWCRRHVLEPLRNRKLFFERPIPWGSAFYQEASAALDAADVACEKRLPGYSLLVKSQLFLFIHALYTNRMKEETAMERQNNHSDKLKALLAFVKDHYGEPLSVDDAAAITGYSSAHFMRLFRQETGQTFIAFLNDYRLAAATYFLRETQDSVSSVASTCGFDNLSYFVRSFHKKYGVSPGVYRKKINKRLDRCLESSRIVCPCL